MSDVKVKFGAEDENLNATLTQVKNNLRDVDAETGKVSKGFSVGFGTIAAGAAAGAAAVKVAGAAMSLAFDGARAVVDQFGNALDFGGKMTDLSKSTGVAVDELVILERAFDNAGVGGDKLGAKMGRMQKVIDEASQGGKEQVEVLNRLGLSYVKLQEQSPTEQMRAFASSIANVIDPGERAALAMKVFGGKTADMMPLILGFDQELGTAKDQVGDFAGVMGRSSGNFDDLGDNLAAVKNKVLEFAAGFMEKALPGLIAFSEKLSSVDAADWGGKLMEKVLKVADVMIGAFRNPIQSIDLLGTALVAAAKSFGNWILNSLVDAGNSIGALMVGGFKVTANTFEGLLVQGTYSMLGIMTDGLIKAASILGGDVEEVARKVGEPLKTSFSVASKLYGMQMDLENKKIEDDLTDIMSGVTRSTKDFFGAQPELDKLREGTQKLEDDGKKFREQFTESKELTFDMREDFGKMNQQAQLTGFALLSAGEPMKKNTFEAKKDMTEILKISEILERRDKAEPPAKNFAEKVQKTREGLEQIDKIFKTKLSKLSIPDLAEKFNIDKTGKSADEMLTLIAQRLKQFQGMKLEIGIDKDRPQEEWDAIMSGLRSTFEDVMSGKADVNLDAKESIKTIKEDLKKEVDVAIQSSKGTTILEDLKTCVAQIRDIVKIIEPKLPQRALV